MTDRYEVDLTERARLDEVASTSLNASGLEVLTTEKPGLYTLVHLDVLLPGLVSFPVSGEVLGHSPEGVYVCLSDGDERDVLVEAVARSLSEPVSPELDWDDWGDQTSPAADAADATSAEPADVDHEEPADHDGSAPEAGDLGSDEAPPVTERDGADQGESDAGEGSEGDGTATSPEPDDDGAAVPAWRQLDPTSHIPLYRQIATLTLRDRVALAKEATRQVRAILVCHTEKSIHMALVTNPQITDEELAEYSGLPHLSSRALRWIGRQDRLLNHEYVATRLARNPATPTDLSRRLRQRLKKEE